MMSYNAFESAGPNLLAQYFALTNKKDKFEATRYDPVGYAQKFLRVEWWLKQQEIAESLVEHRRVFVKAGNGPGKSHVLGGLVNWFFDSFDPGIVLTTAPTAPQVDDILWKEVRLQRKNSVGLNKDVFLPKASRMETAEDHFAVGYTARDQNAFQGRHDSNVLIVFDEAQGIEPQFWTAAEGMMTSDNCYWIVALNPLDSTCQAYEEELKSNWHVITLSALEHPNIICELAGQSAPFPKAVRLQWIRDRIKEWCTEIEKKDFKATTDFEFDGRYYRPGALFEARGLGRWPTEAFGSVWSEALFTSILKPNWELHLKSMEDHAPEIGCDVARFGDDDTTMHVRRGGVSLHHERHNGWSTDRTAGRLKELCGIYGKQAGIDPKIVLTKIDDSGVGGGVTDQHDGYSFVGLSASQKAIEPLKYPNRRSEFWFTTREMAEEGLLDLTKLDSDSQSRLRRQLRAPKWTLDSKGRRVVEEKSKTKSRIKVSPDDADAFNLAYAEPGFIFRQSYFNA